MYVQKSLYDCKYMIEENIGNKLGFQEKRDKFTKVNEQVIIDKKVIAIKSLNSLRIIQYDAIRPPIDIRATPYPRPTGLKLKIKSQGEIR